MEGLLPEHSISITAGRGQVKWETTMMEALRQLEVYLKYRSDVEERRNRWDVIKNMSVYNIIDEAEVARKVMCDD